MKSVLCAQRHCAARLSRLSCSQSRRSVRAADTSLFQARPKPAWSLTARTDSRQVGTCRVLAGQTARSLYEQLEDFKAGDEACAAR